MGSLFNFYFKSQEGPEVVSNCNPGTLEVKAENHEFKISLDYIGERILNLSHLKKVKKKNNASLDIITLHSHLLLAKEIVGIVKIQSLFNKIL